MAVCKGLSAKDKILPARLAMRRVSDKRATRPGMTGSKIDVQPCKSESRVKQMIPPVLKHGAPWLSRKGER